MGLFNFLSDRKKAKEEQERKIQEEKKARQLFEQQMAQKAAEEQRARILLEQQMVQKAAEEKRLKEIQYAKARELRKQIEEENKRIAPGLLEKETPLTLISISKVGQSSMYYYYDDPAGMKIGDIVSFSWETQSHEENDEKEREAYVVDYNGSDIGEITESAVQKIKAAGYEIENVLGIVSKLTLDTDPPKISVSVYRIDDDGRLGSRTFSTEVVGTKYPNDDGSSRQEYVRRLQANDKVVLKASSYNGDPAVEVYTDDGHQIGYLKKDLAKEFCNKLKKDLIDYVRVKKVAIHNNIAYVDIMITIKDN